MAANDGSEGSRLVPKPFSLLERCFQFPPHRITGPATCLEKRGSHPTIDFKSHILPSVSHGRPRSERIIRTRCQRSNSDEWRRKAAARPQTASNQYFLLQDARGCESSGAALAMQESAANRNRQSASSTLCSCFSMCFATCTTSAPTLHCTDASTVRNGLLGCIAHNEGRHGRLQGDKSQECSSFRSHGAKVSTLFILAHSGAGSSALNLPFPPPKSKRDPYFINFDWIRTAHPRSVCRVIASTRLPTKLEPSLA
jgi:hypothetical protein